jgi:hypothetical protein
MPRSNVQVQTGNRILVKFDNQTIGMCQSVRASNDYGMQETSAIGDIHVVEYVPSIARHTLTAAFVVLKRALLEQAGIFTLPENGDSVMLGRVFDVAIIDKDTGRALRTYKDCSFASDDIEVTKHAVVAKNTTILARDVVGVFDSGFVA